MDARISWCVLGALAATLAACGDDGGPAAAVEFVDGGAFPGAPDALVGPDATEPGDAEDVHGADTQPPPRDVDGGGDGAMPDAGDGRTCTIDEDCLLLGGPAPSGCVRPGCVQGSCQDVPVPFGTACDALPPEADPACFDARCDGLGACVATPSAGAACDDGDPCTTGAACGADGTCGDGVAVVCPTTDPCAIGQCDPETGACVAVPEEDGLACDDEDPCTEDTACAGGVCAGGTNLCACDTDADCEDDGDLCNGVPRCVDLPGGGQGCKIDPETKVTCDPAEGVCEASVCDPATGACQVEILAGEACDDGDACTTGDTCGDDGACAGDALTCDDGNPCTEDACDPVAGECVYTPTDALSCDDGDPCTTGDACSGGVCAGVAQACDDGNPCTADACDPETGECGATPLDGDPCDDGTACTEGDACVDGACQGSPLTCGDGNPCTDDACDPDAGCVNAPNTATCDDGDPCTEPDLCDGGVCAGGAQACDDGNPCTGDSCDADGACSHQADDAACDDGNPCTEDWCSASQGCLHKPAAGACDDGNPCTVSDACAGGACAGQPLDCGDGIGCTVDSCDPAEGCVHEPDAGACGDGNPCTADVCDPVAGCQHPPADGGACEDGEVCTEGDVCAGGVCSPGENVCECTVDADCQDGDLCNGVFACQDDAEGVRRCVQVTPPVVCDGPAPGVCQVLACDPATGACEAVEAQDGTPCPDDDPCTLEEACSGGVCESVPDPCDDGVACTADACAPGEGCTHTPQDGACDDGVACTDDACDPTQGCVFSPVPEACDDGVGCTSDTCDPAEGCASAPVDAACSDGLACTVDACDPAEGCTHAPDDGACDDENPCTDDACDAEMGCVHPPNADPCDDGDACTVDDQCAGGACAPGAPLSCDDDDPCTHDACESPDGTCTHAPLSETGCSDGDACTAPDVCQGGECVSGPPDPCDDGFACTLDGCDSDTGCTHVGDDGACDDGNPCTVGTCEPGQGCVFTPVDDWTACDDGTLATSPDVCVAGQCRGFGRRHVSAQAPLLCSAGGGVLRAVSELGGNLFGAVGYSAGGVACMGAGAYSQVHHLQGASPATLVTGSNTSGALTGASEDLIVGAESQIGRLTFGGSYMQYGSDVAVAVTDGPGSGPWGDVWSASVPGTGGDVMDLYYLAGTQTPNGAGRVVRCTRSVVGGATGVACTTLSGSFPNGEWKDLSPVAASGALTVPDGCLECEPALEGTAVLTADSGGGASVLLAGPDDVYSRAVIPGGGGARDVLRRAGDDVWVVGQGGLLARRDTSGWAFFDGPPEAAGADLRAVFSFRGSLVVVGFVQGASSMAVEAILLALPPGADPADAAAWNVVSLGTPREAWDVNASAKALYVVGRDPMAAPGDRAFYWYLPL